MRRKKTLAMAGALLALAAALALGWYYLGPSRDPGWVDDGEWGAPPAPDALAIVGEITSSELAPFEDQASFDAYVGRLGEALRAQARADREWESAHETMLAAPAAEESAEPAAAPGGDESITNTQEAGVDEGGIVKTHGEHLVVLRRGRLFSARLGEDGELAPLSMASVVPDGASGGWYDEMLIHGDTIIVVGFNYQESGTEIGLFDIDADGAITRRSTHYLRSDDYYSSRNYASRLVGDTLLFYMPLALAHLDGGDQVRLGLPATRDRGRAEWRTIIEATQIHRPVQATLHPTLHTVVACDLREPGLRCVAQGVLGPAGRTFYVSPRAVYVWVGPDPWEASLAAHPARAVVYRLPLGEGRIGAMRVAGMPIDQLSFAERADRLHVLVGAEGGGDAMWTAEGDRGALALMSVPLAGFEDGLGSAPRSAFTPLPGVVGYATQNRFVGEHVLFGSYADPERLLYVHPYARQGETARVRLAHGAQRIEAIGARAVAIGASDEGLTFSAIDLAGTPRVAGTYTQASAAQGENRTHGFFYRGASETEGTLGLPVRYPREGRFAEYLHGSAGVLFLRVSQGDGVRFDALGTLDASGRTTEDRCVASCVDWYGNARPIFYRGRVFALLGYELVEGRVEEGRVREIARTNLYDDQPAASP